MNIENGMIPTDGDFGGEPETCEVCGASIDDCEGHVHSGVDINAPTLAGLQSRLDAIDRVLVRMGLDPADYK